LRSKLKRIIPLRRKSKTQREEEEHTEKDEQRDEAEDGKLFPPYPGGRGIRNPDVPR